MRRGYARSEQVADDAAVKLQIVVATRETVDAVFQNAVLKLDVDKSVKVPMHVAAENDQIALERLCVLRVVYLLVFGRRVSAQDDVGHGQIAPRYADELMIHLPRDCRDHVVVAVQIAVELSSALSVADAHNLTV